MEKNRTEYPRTLGQLQKTYHTHNGKIKKKKERKEVFETVMTENFSKLMSYTKPQIQEAQRTISMINAKKSYTYAYHFPLQKIRDKEKNPERSQRKKTPYL